MELACVNDSSSARPGMHSLSLLVSCSALWGSFLRESQCRGQAAAQGKETPPEGSRVNP